MPRKPTASRDDPPEQMRLDRWLKVARLFKTRSQAAAFCQSRHVKVNGKTAKPSQTIRVGDTISIQYPYRNRTFDVQGLSEKSLPAAAARELYLEHLPKVSEQTSELMRYFLKEEERRRRELKGKGRPTKKERRQLEKIKRSS